MKISLELYVESDLTFSGHAASGVLYPIEYHVGLLATFPCSFSLENYPFDTQRCNVSFMVMNAPGTKEFKTATEDIVVPYLNKVRVAILLQ